MNSLNINVMVIMRDGQDFQSFPFIYFANVIKEGETLAAVK